MNDQLKEHMNRLNLEDIIWYIYILLVIFNLISNRYERAYGISKKVEDRNTFRDINIFVFIVILFIYGFFLIRNIKDLENSEKKDSKNNGRKLGKPTTNSNSEKLNYLSVFGGILFFLGGILNLYIELAGYDEELEI